MEGMVEYESSLPILQEVSFLYFLYKFDGYDSAIAQDFARSFDAKTSIVGPLKFEVTEQFISYAAKFLSTGEKWFKKGEIEKGAWCKFLMKVDCADD